MTDPAEISVDQVLNRAEALERRGRIAEAVGLYREILRRFPGNRSAAYKLRRLARSSGNLTANNGAHPSGNVPSRKMLDPLMGLYHQPKFRIWFLFPVPFWADCSRFDCAFWAALMRVTGLEVVLDCAHA